MRRSSLGGVGKFADGCRASSLVSRLAAELFFEIGEQWSQP
jgi:hypothetical protein